MFTNPTPTPPPPGASKRVSFDHITLCPLNNHSHLRIPHQSLRESINKFSFNLLVSQDNNIIIYNGSDRPAAPFPSHLESQGQPFPDNAHHSTSIRATTRTPPRRMLRRAPTVLTLTSEDVKAYEDRREAETFKHMSATAAYQQQQQQQQHQHQRRAQHHAQLARGMSGMELASSSPPPSSDDDGGVEFEDEASYYPSRYRHHGHQQDDDDDDDNNNQEDDDDDEIIYRNEVDRRSSGSDAALAAAAAAVASEAGGEDEVMRELDPDDLGGGGSMDLDAESHHQLLDDTLDGTRDEGNDLQLDDDDEQDAPSPPPAPTRVPMRREPPPSRPHHATTAAGPRYGGGVGRARPGRTTAAGAVTPTPASHQQRDAADRARTGRGGGDAGGGMLVTPDAPPRATRSREERNGVARGGGRR